jgi:RNA polymerase sigma-70 factor (ECF subfamily)
MVSLPTANAHKEDFSKTYVVYYPKLVRFSQTYVPAAQDAENIVQDVFLHLWEHWNEIDTFGHINALLFTSVKNKCIDYLRKQTQRQQREEPLSKLHENELALNLYSLQKLDDSNLASEDIEAIVDEAIRSLPDRCREIFILSRMEGLRHKEIAARLNISTNTIEGQMSIALRKLTTKLKERLPLGILLACILS